MTYTGKPEEAVEYNNMKTCAWAAAKLLIVSGPTRHVTIVGFSGLGTRRSDGRANETSGKKYSFRRSQGGKMPLYSIIFPQLNSEFQKIFSLFFFLKCGDVKLLARL